MIDLLPHGSYLGIILVLVLTGAGLPIPEEVIVIFAGIAGRHGVLHPGLALASCLIGAMLGDLITYGIGRHFGRALLREHRWFVRYLSPERESEIEARIHQYAPRVFFLARFMVGLRSPVYLTAGIVRYPFGRFVLIDSFCASAVICTFFGLSYLFADQINQWWDVIRRAEVILTITVVLAVACAAGYFYWRHRQRVARVRRRQLGRTSRNGAVTDDSVSGSGAVPSLTVGAEPDSHAEKS
jgi:membrane protein DedA with SNARE-associated domain